MQKIQRKYQSELNTSVLAAVTAYLQEKSDQRDFSELSSDVESTAFEAAMKYAQGNQVQAAKILGVARGTLRSKLQTYFGTLHVGGLWHAKAKYTSPKEQGLNKTQDVTMEKRVMKTSAKKKAKAKCLSQLELRMS